MFSHIRDIIGIQQKLSLEKFVLKCQQENYPFTQNIEILKAIILRIMKFDNWGIPYKNTTTPTANCIYFKISRRGNTPYVEKSYGGKGLINFVYLLEQLFLAFEPCFQNIPKIHINLQQIVRGNTLLHAINQRSTFPGSPRVRTAGNATIFNEYYDANSIAETVHATQHAHYKTNPLTSFDDIIVISY